MNNTFLKVLAGVAYVAVVTVNFLANSLPIRNNTTGEVADAYQNLFAPAGYAFSIWGLIYLLLAGYVVYQFTKSGQKKDKLFKKINGLFVISSLANISWIFAWHYEYIGLSVLCIGVLLFSLIMIANILRGEELKPKEKLFIGIPFSVYFGWITVASIANITVFLVSISWDGFGIADYIWTNIILLVGVLIGVLRMHKDKSTAYALVLIWAYLAILFKHISPSGFGGQYPSVIDTLVVCLGALIFFTGKIYFKNIRFFK